MRGEFGKSLTYTLYLYGANGQGVEPYNPEDYTPSIYLFDNLPTRDQAMTGEGAMIGYTVAEWVVEGNGITVTIPPVADPSPNSQVSEEDYYLAIVYQLDELGEEQLILKRITYERPSTQFNALTLTQADLEALDATIKRLWGSPNVPEITDLNASVLKQIRGHFKRLGYRWERLSDTDDLKEAAAYYALHLLFVSQIRSTADFADRKQGIYLGKYQEMIASIVLPYDSNGDDEPDPGAPAEANDSTWSFER